MAPEPASADAVERDLSVARHPSSRREHRADADADTSATAGLPLVRDLSVVSDATAVRSGGRRRAPEVPAAAATGGRRRAPEEPAATPAGGRLRAPETAVAVVSGGRRRAPEEVAVAPTGGRRRAPEEVPPTASVPAFPLERRDVPVPSVAAAAATADPGRHRTADTGLLPAVSDPTATLSDIRRSVGPATTLRGLAIPSARPSMPRRTVASGSAATWAAPSGLESELLTRPMRLSDLPPSGRPRLDGLRGV
jgi:hypothetical protein